MPQGLLGWLAALWPFPAVISSTLLIAWASEVASFFVSRGMALAVLALLQVLPEFSVEAVIAYNAALDPSQMQFVTANFTGANRILVGLALPLIFFLTLWVRRGRGLRRELRLARENSVEVVFLLVPSLYSLVFWVRESITLVDTLVLVAIYAAYLAVLYRLPAAGEEERSQLRGVPARLARRSRAFQQRFAVGAFLVGGSILLFSVEPFYVNTLALAALLLIPAYFLIQWVAPLLSEFPEFLTATYWSRMGRGEVAFMNVVSAKINQWTLLIAMIPLVFAATNFWAGHGTTELPLDHQQQVEVLLTTAQGLFAAACLLKLRLLAWEAAMLLFLWAFQAADPVLDVFLVGLLPSPFGSGALIREWVTLAYFALAGLEFALYGRQWGAFAAFRGVWLEHVRARRPARRPEEAEP